MGRHPNLFTGPDMMPSDYPGGCKVTYVGGWQIAANQSERFCSDSAQSPRVTFVTPVRRFVLFQSRAKPTGMEIYIEPVRFNGHDPDSAATSVRRTAPACPSHG